MVNKVEYIFTAGRLPVTCRPTIGVLGLRHDICDMHIWSAVLVFCIPVFLVKLKRCL